MRLHSFSTLTQASKLTAVSCLLAITLGNPIALAQRGGGQNNDERRDNRERNQVSPARNIEGDREARPTAPIFEVRAYDGSNNNIEDAKMGAAHIHLHRYTTVEYADGISSLAGEGRLSARSISNIVFAQEHDAPNSHGATDFLWQWGQFLDHDID